MLAAGNAISLNVTTVNALGLSDTQTVNLKLSEGLYPAIPDILAIQIGVAETSIDSGGAKGVVTIYAATPARTVPETTSVELQIRRTDER